MRKPVVLEVGQPTNTFEVIPLAEGLKIEWMAGAPTTYAERAARSICSTRDAPSALVTS
jgi:hypothetical protein